MTGCDQKECNMTWWWLRKCLLLLGIVVLVLCWGCAQLDFNEKMKMVKELQRIAAESGAAYALEFRFGGRPGIGYTQEISLNTDMNLVMRVDGRAKLQPVDEVEP